MLYVGRMHYLSFIIGDDIFISFFFGPLIGICIKFAKVDSIDENIVILVWQFFVAGKQSIISFEVLGIDLYCISCVLYAFLKLRHFRICKRDIYVRIFVIGMLSAYVFLICLDCLLIFFISEKLISELFLVRHYFYLI